MKVSVAIMAHPRREHFVSGLVEQLPHAEVVWDRHNDRWDTGRRAMLAHDPDGDWHVVVQDDAILCRDFLAGVEAALAHVPSVPASFYTGRTRPHGAEVTYAVQCARAAGRAWLAMRGPIWGVAVAIPTALIAEMLAGCDGRDIRNYDMRMESYFTERGVECWYSLPSLVQHRVGEENPSLVPGRSNARARTAHSFIGDRSPLEVDWSTGPWRLARHPEGWEYAPHDLRAVDPAGIERYVPRGARIPPDLKPINTLALPTVRGVAGAPAE